MPLIEQNPLNLFNDIYKLLNENGALFIVCHSYNSFVNKEYKAGADPSTIPGCPEFALLIISIPSDLIAAIDSSD